ncbi:MAG: PQQ-binding-like beta-propeller repeat protein, partial [bacterium]
EVVTPDSSQIWSSPAVAAGVIYVTTYGGTNYAFSAETGDLLGSYSLPGYIHSSPAITNNYLYVGGSDGNLYAFRKPAIRQPQHYFLYQNYPNPFNIVTKIKYELPKAGYVSLSVFNLLGQEVKTLVDEYREPGFYEIFWYGQSNEERKVASSVYIYRIRVRNALSGRSLFTRTREMLLLR